MNMRLRKAVGCAGLLAYIAVYAVLATSLALYLTPIQPFWAEMVFYLIAGIVWIFPLKPLFGWMNRGS